MLPPFQTPKRGFSINSRDIYEKLNFKQGIFLCAQHVSMFVLFYFIFFGNDLTLIGNRCKNYRVSNMLIIFSFLDCGHFVFLTTLAFHLRRCVLLISFVNHSFQPSGQ